MLKRAKVNWVYVIKYLDRKSPDIVAVIFSIEKEDCYIYLYKDMENEENSSVAGLTCSSLYNLDFNIFQEYVK